MTKQELNQKIFFKLKKKFPKKTENAIRVKLSKLSRKHNVTLNASAEIWAKEENFSVWGLLAPEDKSSLQDKTFQQIIIKKTNGKLKSIVKFIEYSTQDKFLKAHIDEINRGYTYGCYTSAFILIRKVLENLIVTVIKKKFPGNTEAERSLYLDFSKGRIHDLSILIGNLKNKSNSFNPDEKKLIQRILQLSEQFKDDANDKTHSLYHISFKKELEGTEPQMIFNLIETYFKDYP